MTFDTSNLDAKRLAAVVHALSHMDFPPDWDDRTIPIYHSPSSRAFVWMDPENPIMYLPWNIWQTKKRLAKTFAHECGHLDDLLFMDAEERQMLKEIRYSQNQVWSHKPPWYKWYTDTPIEWYAEAFGVAFYPQKRGKKWTRWGRAVHAVRGI